MFHFCLTGEVGGDQRIVKSMIRKAIFSVLSYSMIFIILSLSIGRSLAAGTGHEVSDQVSIDWIIDQIRTNNNDFASDYIAERIRYLVSEDTYRPGTEFPFRDIETSVITDHQTQKDIYLRGAECYGYARYVYFMLFGSFDGNPVTENLKTLHAGAHIRTNSASKVDQNNKPYTLPKHSIIFLCRDDEGTGFYGLDANWSQELDNGIRVEHWTDQQFRTTFSRGIETITEPGVYPRTGDYSASKDVPYYNAITDLNSAGTFTKGTTLRVEKLDTKQISNNTPVKFENKGKNQISFRSIMAEVRTADGKTVWIAFNEPNALKFKGKLTSVEPIVNGSAVENNPGFLQNAGHVFDWIKNAIFNFFHTIVSPVIAAPNESQEPLASNGNSSNGLATAGDSAAAQSPQEQTNENGGDTFDHPIEDGTYIISLNPNTAEINDFTWIALSSDSYRMTKVAGGYQLSCFVLDCVTISYDDYTRIAAGETISTAVGLIGHAEGINEYAAIGFYVDDPVIFNEGKYFINQIPDANQPEVLRDPYLEIWSNAEDEGYPIIAGAVPCELFVSEDAMVLPFHYVDSAPMRFSDYLVSGNAETGGVCWSYAFYATIQNNEIIHLVEIVSSIDE